MNIRDVSQYTILILHLLIVFAAGVGWRCVPHKKPSLVVWGLYGVVGVAFYAYILFVVDVSIPSVEMTRLSSIRSLVQTSFVVTWLWLWNIKNLSAKRKNDGRNYGRVSNPAERCAQGSAELAGRYCHLAKTDNRARRRTRLATERTARRVN